jgi:hypothetical protein
MPPNHSHVTFKLILPPDLSLGDSRMHYDPWSPC